MAQAADDRLRLLIERVERLDLAAEFDTWSGTRTAGDILHDDPRATLLDQPR